MKAPAMSAVLKSGQARFDPQPRALHLLEVPNELVPAASVDGAPKASEGIWISESDLEALQARCEARGRQLGASDASAAAAAQVNARSQHMLEERMQVLATAQLEKWRNLSSAVAVETQASREALQSQVTEWTFIAVTRLLGEASIESVASAVRQVLSEARIDEPLTVLLHPRDFADLQHSQRLDPNGWPATVVFKADETITLGGCRIKSSIRNLDARLEVQLALLRGALDRAREGRHAG